jgi:hypothetical protein
MGQSDESVERWLNKKSNLINLLLTDMHTNKLMALWRLFIPMTMAEEIRDVLERQDEKYNTLKWRQLSK